MNVALEATTKGKDIVVDAFFKQYGLKWENLRGCTTDGTPAILERRSGLRARVMCHGRGSSCDIYALHCFVMQGLSW